MPVDNLPALETIMACVDGSEIGYRAADFALALAKKVGAKVFFANVIGASTSEKEYTISADMVGSFERLGMEALSKCEEKARNVGVKFETLELEGDPVQEILRSTKETHSDCIVIGRKGLGRIEKLLLGSVSEKILKLSDVPVIIVK